MTLPVYTQVAPLASPLPRYSAKTQLLYNTASLATGEHVIVVKVTDGNNACGTATFKFTKKKAASAAQPPAAKPPASPAGGQLQGTSPSGTQNLVSGSKPQIPQGGQITLSAKCQELREAIPLLLVVWYDDMISEMMQNRQEMWETKHMRILGILVNTYELNCGKFSTFSPDSRSIARSGYGAFAYPALPALAESAGQITLDLQQGPARFQVLNEQLTLHVRTSTVTVLSQGKNNFGVLHDPDNNQTYIACYAGIVAIQPTNTRLAAIALAAGQQVQATQNNLSQPAPIEKSDLSVLALALCGGVPCLGLLGLIGGVVLFTRSRRARPSAPPPSVAPRKPTDLPEHGAPRKPTNLPK